jgi:cytochrome c-type biogenesis protein CcmH
MAVFWILATLMTLAALAFVLVPLLRGRLPSGPSSVEANLEVLRGQRREIEADVANGTLPADARAEALAELVGRAQADLAEAGAPSPAAQKKPWIIAAIVAFALPGLAFGIYLASGTPAATDARVSAVDPASSFTEQQIVDMVDSLAKKVRDRPDDAKGWALLARSTAALGRFEESAAAYERLAKLVPDDAQVLADYADALGMAQGKTLVGRPYELIKQALAIDAQNPKALALAGTAALDSNDYATAAGYWEKLASLLPPGSEDEAQVQAILGDVRAKAAASGKALPALKAAPATAASTAGAKSVSGLVSIAPEIAAKIGPSDTLFVFARAESGPRMPLAVLRGSARELPLAFALDDTMAMAPNMKLSGATSVRIEARISRTGNATPQPGDLVGASGAVRPGARDVKVVVNRVLP